MMTLDDAVNLVLYAFEHCKAGEVFVQKAPAASIATLVSALKKLLDKHDYHTKIIGTRHGEKLYETLLSREEMAVASDLGRYFCVEPDLRDLNYTKFTEQGMEHITEASDYNSHNTEQLSTTEMAKLLTKLPEIKALIDKTVSSGIN